MCLKMSRCLYILAGWLVFFALRGIRTSISLDFRGGDFVGFFYTKCPLASNEKTGCEISSYDSGSFVKTFTRRATTSAEVNFDVLSIGSFTRPDYFRTQLETWGTQAYIRSFIVVTELDDFDPTCDRMTRVEVEDYVASCRAGTHVDSSAGVPGFNFTPTILKTDAQNFTALHFGDTESRFAPHMTMKRRLPGWFCAQRRYLQGMNILQNFLYSEDRLKENFKEGLPDYLVVVDDDTYFNAHLFLQTVRTVTPTLPRAYAGCLFQRNVTGRHHISWEFPYGGFGTVFSKGALINMLTPIRCNSNKTQDQKGQNSIHAFLENACASLKTNELGEQAFFQPGMNVIELFSNYSARSKRLCMHSDWLIGYIAARYLSLLPPLSNEAKTFHPLKTWPNECGNHSLAAHCDPSMHTFCHRQTAEDFKKAYAHVVMAGTSLGDAVRFHTVSGSVHAKVENNVNVISEIVAKLNKTVESNRTRVNVTLIATRTATDGLEWVERLKSDTILTKDARNNFNLSAIWHATSSWMTVRQVLPESFETHKNELAHVFHQLKHGKIINASFAKGGSQMKLVFIMEGGQQVLFKPSMQNYRRDHHNSEIAAFHLSRLLNMRRAPVAVGRRIHLPDELFPVSSKQLQGTFINPYCFHGICERGCNSSRNSLICADEHDGRLEGAMILMLPKKYGDEQKELAIAAEPSFFPIKVYNEWDQLRVNRLLTKDYCDAIVKKDIAMDPHLLDIVETSIMDFLIQNTDRHQNEYISNDVNGAILLLDQGKGFSSPNTLFDDRRLLLALEQCCVLRDATYEHLHWIARWNLTLSDALLALTSVDIATPARLPKLLNVSGKILFDGDLKALDRRFAIVMEAIDTCIANRGTENVLKDTFLS